MKSKSESVSPKKKAASARNKSVTVDYWNLAWTHTFSLLFFAARELDRLAECLRRRDDCENNTWKRKVTTRTYRPSQPALRSSSCQWSQTFSLHICWTRGSWQSSLHNVRALVGESSLPDYILVHWYKWTSTETKKEAHSHDMIYETGQEDEAGITRTREKRGKGVKGHIWTEPMVLYNGMKKRTDPLVGYLEVEKRWKLEVRIISINCWCHRCCLRCLWLDTRLDWLKK